MPIRQSILHQTLVLVLLTQAPWLGHALYEHLHAHDERVRVHTANHLASSAEAVAREAENALEQARRVLSHAASWPAVRALNSNQCDNVLAAYVAPSAVFAEFATLDAKGQVICSDWPATMGAPRAAATEVVAQSVRTRTFAVGPATASGHRAGSGIGHRHTANNSHASGELWLAQPLLAADGAALGAAALRLNLTALGATGLASMGAPTGRATVHGLIDANGLLVAHATHASRTTDGPDTAWATALVASLAPPRGASTSSTPTLVQHQGSDGVDRWLVFAPVAGTAWVSFAAVPTTALSHAAEHANTLGWGAALMCLGFAIGLALWVARRTAQPLSRVVDVARLETGRPDELAGAAAWPREVHAVAAALGQALTQQRAAQRAWAQSQALTAALLQASGDGVIHCDANGRVLRMNELAQQLTGWSQEQALSQPLQEVFDCSDARVQTAQWPRHTAAEPAVAMALVSACQLRARGGASYRIAGRIAPVLNNQGAWNGLVVVFSDITALHAAQRQLERDAELLGQASEVAKIGGWQLDVATMHIEWTGGMREIYGLPPDAPAQFFRAREFLSPEHAALASDALHAALEHGAPWDFEIHVHAADQVRRWVRSQGVATLREGRVVRLTGVLQDITEQRRAQRAVEEQQRRMSAVVETGMDGIVATDAQGRVMIFNAAAERIFGWSAQQMIGQSLDVLLPERFRTAHGSHLSAFGRGTGGARSMGGSRSDTARSVTALRADGEEIPIEASISHSSVGGERMYIAFVRDVSERVRAARTLMDQRLELSALTRRLIDSEEQTHRALAQSLHDQLGQTLTAVRLGLDALDGQMEPGAKQATAHWRARLSELVNRGVTQLRHVLVDLRPAMLEELGLAAAIENELINHPFVNDELLVIFEPDEAVLAQRWPDKVEYAAFMIAREAVANAALHAGARCVEVRLGQHLPELHLSIRDDGQGIPVERRRGRAGHLGLVGMRERAIAIGGHLHVESAPGVGTTITLSWSPP